MLPRPPIVAILGHVDHGKTSLLDFIRKTHLAEKEHGGITQKIGAYEISTDIKGYKTNKITFIDTPGHESFSKMRSRGARVADIAILLVDAKDSVMPQTVESISHIKAAKIPLIVAINKIDLPEANPEKVKNDLIKYEILVEEKGGEVPAIAISAKTGKGVHELLETILLIGADRDLSYSLDAIPSAIIIETKKDKRGLVGSAIMKEGKFKVADFIYIDGKKAKIRSLFDDLGQPIKEVIPSKPFEILGFHELPEVGSIITSVKQNNVVEIQSGIDVSKRTIDMDSLLHPKKELKKLTLILKTNSQGSIEAISQSISKNETIEIILKAIGEINKSDVFLAKVTKAIIVGFAVGMSAEVKQIAKQEKVIIKTYNIIYELLDELEEVTKLLKEKEIQEKNLKGEAKVLATFIIEGEKVYGVKITKGKVNLQDNIEIYRHDRLIGKSKLVSLKIRAKAVAEIKKDQEAGMVFGPQLDIRVGDMVQFIS